MDWQEVLQGVKEIFALLFVNALAFAVWYFTGDTWVLMLAFMTDAWVLDKNLDILKKATKSVLEFSQKQAKVNERVLDLMERLAFGENAGNGKGERVKTRAEQKVETPSKP